MNSLIAASSLWHTDASAPSSRMPSMSFVSTPLGTSTSLLMMNRNGCCPCSQYLYACERAASQCGGRSVAGIGSFGY